MTRYYLHVYNQTGFVCDEEGEDLSGLEAANAKAIAGIRGILSEEVKAGKLDLRGRIEIAGEAGELLHTVRFAETVLLHLDVDSE